jgi:hypothetical protein
LALSCAFACAVLWLAAAPRAHAGDAMPQAGCDTVSTDPTLVRIGFWVMPRNIDVHRVVMDPDSAYGAAPTPILAMECPDGWTCAPDTVAGGWVLTGYVYAGGQSPEFFLHAAAYEVPFFARLYQFADGPSLMQPFIALYSCASASSPAQASSWGQVKALYR